MNGRMDRIIEIQRRVVTRDSVGGEIETWVKVEGVWAELLEQKPSESYLPESKRLANRSTRRYQILAGVKVDETMRVIDDYGKTWDIRGIMENDRQVPHAPVAAPRLTFTHLF